MNRSIPLDSHDATLRKAIVTVPIHALTSKTGNVWVPVRTDTDNAMYRYLPISLSPCRSWPPVRRTVIEQHYGLLTPLCSIAVRPEVERMHVLFCDICHLHPLRNIDCTACLAYWRDTELGEFELPSSSRD